MYARESQSGYTWSAPPREAHTCHSSLLPVFISTSVKYKSCCGFFLSYLKKAKLGLLPSQLKLVVNALNVRLNSRIKEKKLHYEFLFDLIYGQNHLLATWFRKIAMQMASTFAINNSVLWLFENQWFVDYQTDERNQKRLWNIHFYMKKGSFLHEKQHSQDLKRLLCGM